MPRRHLLLANESGSAVLIALALGASLMATLTLWLPRGVTNRQLQTRLALGNDAVYGEILLRTIIQSEPLCTPAFQGVALASIVAGYTPTFNLYSGATERFREGQAIPGNSDVVANKLRVLAAPTVMAGWTSSAMTVYKAELDVEMSRAPGLAKIAGTGKGYSGIIPVYLLVDGGGVARGCFGGTSARISCESVGGDYSFTAGNPATANCNLSIGVCSKLGLNPPASGQTTCRGGASSDVIQNLSPATAAATGVGDLFHRVNFAPKELLCPAGQTVVGFTENWGVICKE